MIDVSVGIRERRKASGMTQDELAGYLGITREYYSKIESGKRRASDDLMKQINDILELYNPEKHLQILFDYVRIRFPTKDAEHIIEDVMGIRLDYMLSEGRALYGYAAQYVLGDIVVMVSDEPGKGVLLELKGKGCRQFEIYLEAQHRTWFDFLRQARNERAIMKRIDLAINDRAGWLNIAELAEKCKRDECVTLFRSYKNYQSGELIRAQEEDADIMGNTLYLGSLKSEIYFCIYEKDYEQYVKVGIPLEDAEIKNRFEIRLKDQRAEHAMDDLLEYEDAGKTAFAIINHYVRFLSRDDTKDRREWEMDKRWKMFLGEADRQIVLTTAPEPYTLERSLNWLTRQVAPTLKMVRKLDAFRGNADTIEQMIDAAKLSPQHRKVLEQQMVGTKNVLTKRYVSV